MAIDTARVARLSEDLAYQANAARLLGPFAPDIAEAHLKNARTLYAQLGAALSVPAVLATAPVSAPLMMAAE